jgi:hypothetical protein
MYSSTVVGYTEQVCTNETTVTPWEAMVACQQPSISCWDNSSITSQHHTSDLTQDYEQLIYVTCKRLTKACHFSALLPGTMYLEAVIYHHNSTLLAEAKMNAGLLAVL